MSRSVKQKNELVNNNSKAIDLIHLLMRVVYTILAWYVLGKGISSSTFFVSMFLFVFPILLDYLQFYFSGCSRQWLLNIEVFVCIVWFIFSLLGLTGIFVVQMYNDKYLISTAADFIGFQGNVISLQRLWWLLGTMPFFAAMDFACRRLIDKDF